MTQRTTRNSQRAAGLEDLFTFLDPSGNSIPGTNTPSHPPTPANMSSQPESAHIETLDETPDETLGTTNHQAEASGTRSIRWFRLPETLHLHPSVQTELLRSSQSIPGRYYKGQLYSVPSERFRFRLLQTRTIGSN